MVFNPNALEIVPIRTIATEIPKNPIQVYKILVLSCEEGTVKNEPDRTIAFLTFPLASD